MVFAATTPKGRTPINTYTRGPVRRSHDRVAALMMQENAQANARQRVGDTFAFAVGHVAHPIEPGVPRQFAAPLTRSDLAARQRPSTLIQIGTPHAHRRGNQTLRVRTAAPVSGNPFRPRMGTMEGSPSLRKNLPRNEL